MKNIDKDRIIKMFWIEPEELETILNECMPDRSIQVSMDTDGMWIFYNDNMDSVSFIDIQLALSKYYDVKVTGWFSERSEDNIYIEYEEDDNV